MEKSRIRLKGTYALSVTRDGKQVHKQGGSNLVVTAGEALAAARLGPTPPAALDWMAFGDDGTAVTKSDIALAGSELVTREQSVTDTVTATSLTLTFQLTAAAPISGIKEIGVFNAITTGTMMSRFLTQEFDMDTSDVLDVSWSLEFLGID